MYSAISTYQQHTRDIYLFVFWKNSWKLIFISCFELKLCTRHVKARPLFLESVSQQTLRNLIQPYCLFLTNQVTPIIKITGGMQNSSIPHTRRYLHILATKLFLFNEWIYHHEKHHFFKKIFSRFDLNLKLMLFLQKSAHVICFIFIS